SISSVAQIKPNATSPGSHHLGQNAPAVIDDAVRRWRKHMGDDIAGLEERQKLGQRRYRLTHMDHHRQMEYRRHLPRPAEHFKIIRPGDVPRQPRLDADTHLAV